VRWWKLVKPSLIVGAVSLALGVLGAVAYIESGVYNVAASKPHTSFTFWLTHETMIHSVRRQARSIEAPARFSGDQLVAGFCEYEAHCVACHGAAGVGRQQWVSGLEPSPPYLLDIHQQFSRKELFWVVKNGIKMTGMPSWKNEMSDQEIWSVVAWLEASAKLPPQAYVRWRNERPCRSYPKGLLAAP
jgi:mono/diheme cytochrome c family protein